MDFQRKQMNRGRFISDASSLYSFELISVKNSFVLNQDENEQENATS